MPYFGVRRLAAAFSSARLSSPCLSPFVPRHLRFRESDGLHRSPKIGPACFFDFAFASASVFDFASVCLHLNFKCPLLLSPTPPPSQKSQHFHPPTSPHHQLAAPSTAPLPLALHLRPANKPTDAPKNRPSD